MFLLVRLSSPSTPSLKPSHFSFRHKTKYSGFCAAQPSDVFIEQSLEAGCHYWPKRYCHELSIVISLLEICHEGVTFLKLFFIVNCTRYRKLNYIYKYIHFIKSHRYILFILHFIELFHLACSTISSLVKYL